MNVTGNVGIGNNAPAAKLDVLNASTNTGAIINNNNTANTNNALNVFNANVSNTGYSNSALLSQRGTGSLANTFLFVNQPTSITGIDANNNGIGVQGTTQDGIGIAGLSTNGIGVRATSAGSATALRAEVFFGSPTAYALQTIGGRVQIAGQGAAAGRVLTSDAAGNATWQDNTSQSVGITMRGFSAGIVVPNATTVPITQWTFLDNEDGGANYNSGTGGYTITKAGTYQVNVSVIWLPFTAPANFISLRTDINGGFYTADIQSTNTVGGFKINRIAFAKRFNVGDVVNFTISQNSGLAQTTNGFVGENSFSIQFLHK